MELFSATLTVLVVLHQPELRKEHARGGLRKDIIQSDEEEDAKKVSPSTLQRHNLNRYAAAFLLQNENGGGPANEENAQEELKTHEPKEKVIRAPQTQQIN